jgi:predicted dehydrogenase
MSTEPKTRPRLGFLGVGWIGRNRMEAVGRSGLAEIVAISDSVTEQAIAAQAVTRCRVAHSYDELLDQELDGVVIATPSALHAEQATRALEHGLAVFCQKPLGRTAAETAKVVDAARSVDRLLGVDLSYRHLEGARLIRDLIQRGDLGTIYAADLVFHNAYGPDKPWFYDPALSGGGCVMDLGIHLIDLAMWMLDPERVIGVSSRLFSKGELLFDSTNVVEDYAIAELDLQSGAAVRLACSWNLPAGRHAVIQASFFGTRGGAALTNVEGSFYDFAAERFHGTSRQGLSAPPDDWGGRAILEWARRLAAGEGFDPKSERLIELAVLIDTIYERSRLPEDETDGGGSAEEEPVLVPTEAAAS